MSSTVKPTKAKTLAGVQALIAGTQKHLPTGSFTIGNATYSASSLIAAFQGLVDAMAKQDDAKATAKDALTALRDEKKQVNPLIKGYRQTLITMFGNVSQTLADFGLTPPKARAPLSAEKKVAAQARTKATRIARGTKGPKAKLAIKGTASVDTHVPPVTPPAKPTS